MSKPALKRITDTVEGTDAAFAIAVYVALVSLANGEGKGDQTKPFTAPISKIAAYAGMRYRKAWSMVQLLKGIGLLQIEDQVVEGTKLQAPSRFTLCTIDIPLCTVEVSNRADSSNNSLTTPKDRTKETSVFSKTPSLALEEKKTGMGKPEWEAVYQYGHSAGHSLEAIRAWWRINTEKSWKLKDRATGRLKLIQDWPSALDAFCNSIDTQPTADKTNNEEFWLWVRAENLDENQVINWIEFNTKKKWKRKNRLSGEMEPIFDYRASCLAFLQKIEDDTKGAY